MNKKILSNLYFSAFGANPLLIEALPGAGSNRKYFRLQGADGSGSVIGVVGTCFEENRAFIALARHFASHRLPVPEILAVSDDGMAYLTSDLGNLSLFDAISSGRSTGSFSVHETELLQRTIALLPSLQFLGAEGFDFSLCYPPVEFQRSIAWDLNYFKYCFLKPSGVEFLENRLEDDFAALSSRLMAEDCSHFMYRDFQSRNVMINPSGNPSFIDFQGGRRGPIHYDVASLLWQAKANLPSDLRLSLIDVYLNALSQFTAVDKAQFIATLQHFVLFRTLQVLGAYGFRGFVERKPHFLQSVPYALRNLKETISIPEISETYPYLCSTLQQVINHFGTEIPATDNYNGLTVTVMSFSYKKGYPLDTSGNGGGFVFDCRALHNPGRYDEYKQLTGLDAPVIEFIENDGGMATFLSHVYSLVDAAVERYLKRGFTHLMVCFGCTGGQHRSVYGAQHTALHLHEKYGVRVDLTHREQKIHTVLNPSSSQD